MKIGFTGIDIPEGKSKYNDLILKALAEKDKPKKVSPFFVKFLKDEYVDCEAIVIHKDYLLGYHLIFRHLSLQEKYQKIRIILYLPFHHLL